MKNFVITVARGFGSGGRDIAAMLADELGVHSYDKRILTLASQYSGYPEHFFREADETLNGSLITKQLQALPKQKACRLRVLRHRRKMCRLYPEGL